jgi:hypothetical protein
MMVEIFLERAANRKADKIVLQDIVESDFTLLTDRMATGRNHNEADRADRKSLEFLGGIGCVRDNTDVRVTLGNCPRDLSAGPVLKFDVNIAVSSKERGQRRWEQFRYCHGVGEQAHVTPQALGVVTQLTAHLLQLLRYNSRMMYERRTYGREPKRAKSALAIQTAASPSKTLRPLNSERGLTTAS